MTALKLTPDTPRRLQRHYPMVSLVAEIERFQVGIAELAVEHYFSL